MAGKIEIFKLDIDVDAAIDSQSELKTVLDATKASLDALAKSGDTSSKQYVELQAEVKRLNSEYNAAQTQLGKMLNLRGKEIKTVQEGEAALTILNKEWAKQAQLYGSNSKEADDLAKKHAELKERTRELRLGIGDTSTNVGNYTQSMKEAIGQSGLLQKVQTNYNQTLMISQTIFSSVKNEFNAVVNGYRQGKKEAEAMAGSQKLLAASTNYTNTALKLFKVALISTGIGAIVVLLGSLVAWFSKTQKGIDFVNKALAGLGAAFDVIIDRVAKIGGALIKFITGDFSGAFNDIKDAVTGVNQELVTEIALAYKLQEAMQKLEKQETLLDFRRAAANTRIKELNKLIEDTTKTTNERIKAAKEVERLETEIAAQELSNAQQALAHAQGKFSSDEKSLELLERLKNGTIEYDEVLKNLGLSESTKEDVDKFLAAFQKAEEAQQRSFEVRTTNQNKLNTLLNEEQRKREEAAKAAIDAAKRVADEAIKEQQAQLKLFIQQQGVRAKSLEEQLKMSQDVADREIAILDAQLKNRNITQTEYDAQYLAIKNELAKQQANASVENAQRELNEYITANQSKLDNEKYFSDESLRIEQERLNGLAQARRDFETTRLTEGVINQQQYNDAINAINEENRIALQDAQIARDEAKKEAQAVDLANQMAIDEMNFKNQFDLESFRLEQQKQQELATAEQTGASKTLIEKKYAKLQQDIEEKKQEAKLALAGDVFSGIANLLGKESKAGKAAAIAAAVINTAQGVTKALSQGGILGVAMGAVVAATGAVNIVKIMNTETPKAEQGGLFDVGGNRHYAGGTKFYGEDGSVFEAEQGELIGVMNRRAAMMFKSFNDEYRGNSTSTRNYLAGGGFVQTSSLGRNTPSVSQNNIDYASMARYIGEEVALANLNLPAPVVTVEDINAGQSSYARVINRADL